MATSMIELEVPEAVNITVTDDALTIELVDCRTLSVPLEWYPRLVHATQEERDNWELYVEVGHIHWEDLDEDISVEGLLAGRRSGESEDSFARWLKARVAAAEQVAKKSKATDTDDSLPIWEKIASIGKSAPEGTWDDVPTDGSINYKHYLYGHPKREVE